MIVAGFGFRAAASVESLTDALQKANGSRADAVATAADKAATPEFVAFGQTHHLRILEIAADALAEQCTVTQSSASRATRGTGSVAEAAALAAAGAGARLLQARVVSGDGLATCALAEGGGP
ncbi:MAG: cobalamin biosynthesis protein [Pseudomonadota bacterium]